MLSFDGPSARVAQSASVTPVSRGGGFKSHELTSSKDSAMFKAVVVVTVDVVIVSVAAWLFIIAFRRCPSPSRGRSL
jgi:hypothetical protein